MILYYKICFFSKMFWKCALFALFNVRFPQCTAAVCLGSAISFHKDFFFLKATYWLLGIQTVLNRPCWRWARDKNCVLLFDGTYPMGGGVLLFNWIPSAPHTANTLTHTHTDQGGKRRKKKNSRICIQLNQVFNKISSCQNMYVHAFQFKLDFGWMASYYAWKL